MDKLIMPQMELEDGCGFIHQHSVQETYPLHTHDFFEIFYIVSGMALHHINGEEKLLQSGDLVLVRPKDTHSYAFLNNWDFEIISIGIPCDEFYSAVDYLGVKADELINNAFSPTFALSGYQKNDILSKLVAISSKPHGKERRLYFRRLLVELLYLFLSEKDCKVITIPKYLSEIILEMSKTENFITGLPRMLDISCISQEHLTREFRKYLNITPTSFINLKRLDYAAQLLLESNYEIADICYSSGFNNLSHFYHKFKERFHCSPAQFKKLYQKKTGGSQ